MVHQMILDSMHVSMHTLHLLMHCLLRSHEMVLDILRIKPFSFISLSSRSTKSKPAKLGVDLCIYICMYMYMYMYIYIYIYNMSW